MRSATYQGLPFKGVAVDSRSISPGNVFFALPGEKVDGHAFLHEAAKNGAAAAVVQQGYGGQDYGLPLVRTADVLGELQQLAARFAEKSRAKIVAVTGSVGKTTTKRLIADLLKNRFAVAASPANYNSQIGIPLTILNHTTGKEDVWVLEMGMTEPGNIAKLVAIAPPALAVLTKVALVHSEHVPSLSAIARAKMEICSHSATSTLVCDHEIKLCYADLFADYPSVRPVTFSTVCKDADFFWDAEAEAMDIAGHCLGTFPLTGKQHKHNLLAAIVTARLCGLKWEDAAQKIPELTLPERRMEVTQKKGVTFVNDSYNAAPVSVVAALENLPEPKQGGRRIAVLGQMLDLGQFSEEGHREVGNCALKCVDEVFCFGKECRPILQCWESAGRTASLTENQSELKMALSQTVKPGDVVLLKGSCANQLWKVMEAFA